ncbi:hypothetical protein BT63DRAFT_439285 [Microthyrium microscopicum]|uniref:Extracellular membrane protein CFEM domain-containing protein n=1 Tax=Microthyrium microscopicum TaxID=703497 RepID=A0A6A6UEH2_9PEZI|nr:hypothetical protein BT63DRAFT_439285 [Microthyrium microscopicum]
MKLVPLLLFLASSSTVLAQKGNCDCTGDPRLPVCWDERLGPKPLCQCFNNVEDVCWRLSGKTCAEPSPYVCDKLGPNGKPTLRTSIDRATAESTFLPASGKSGAGGLNCVDLGYCYRPTKAKTTLTLTLPDGTAIVTVPVGLPTDALPTLGVLPTKSDTDPVIVFTPEAMARRTVKQHEMPVTMMPL